MISDAISADIYITDTSGNIILCKDVITQNYSCLLYTSYDSFYIAEHPKHNYKYRNTHNHRRKLNKRFVGIHACTTILYL